MKDFLSYWYNKLKLWISIGITYFKKYWYVIFGLLVLYFFGSKALDLFTTKKEEYEEKAKTKKNELKKINTDSAHAIKKANKLAEKNQTINDEIKEAVDEYKKENSNSDSASSSIDELSKHW